MHRARAAAFCLAGLSAALVALLACGTVVATELYKWTDDKGVVHYSDTPPPKGKDTRQKLRLTGTESPNPAAADTKTADKPAGNGSAPVSLPDTPDNRKRACDQAHAALELLQGDAPLADSASGKPIEANDRAERLSAAQRTASMYCQRAD